VHLSHGGEGRPFVRGNTSRGFSLTELLVVIAFIALAVAIAIPLAGEMVRQAKLRAAADNLATDLRAARMIAVSKRVDVDVTVELDPVNAYEYLDANDRLRRIDLPSGVRIAECYADPCTITFKPRGSIDAPSSFPSALKNLIPEDDRPFAAAAVRLDVDLSGGTERWVAYTTTLGVSKLHRHRL
jgi:prepilin-type N-terminal cleavage/methylation domain-containing protein